VSGAAGHAVRALRYRFTPARWLLTRALGRRGPPGLKVALSGVRPAMVRLPVLDGWQRVTVLRSGICGSDVALLTGATGPQLSPFVSLPCVPGHEILGLLDDGQRVVIDPVLGCTVRGLPPCGHCAAGRAALCERFAEGRLAPGMMLGFCRDVPGGWSERILAHDSQLHPVPASLADEAAVLAEPLAVALHAILARPPAAGERVLVLGAGTIGLCVVAGLRLLESPAQVFILARRPHQADQARRMGASEVVLGLSGAERAAEGGGWGRGFPGLMGVRGWTGGFDQVYDAVGSRLTLGAALRLTRAGGRIALLGGSAVLRKLDLTQLWYHELDVDGGFCYGPEPAFGGRHTLDLALGLLRERGHPPLGSLVTHRFPLAGYRSALQAAFFHGRSGAIKVVFEPQK
jgi:L-iditol 2-dehydrogenase